MPDYEPQGRGVTTQRGHEGADLSAKKIAVTTTLLVLFLVGARYSVNGVVSLFASQSPRRGGISGTAPIALGAQITPSPRLQADPKAELDALKIEQMRQLSSWGWNDAAHTTARIPIDEAKGLLLQRGLPRVGAQAPPPPAPLPEETKNVYAR
jgi:hypothetical protein